jgi:signal transduction histidine kinase
MSFGLWQRLRHYSVADLARAVVRFPSRAVDLLKIPAPDVAQLTDRITTMERDLVLPVKTAGIAMLVYSFNFKQTWIGTLLTPHEIAIDTTQYFLWVYILANAAVAGLLLWMNRFPLALVQWSVFAMCLIDGIFLSALIVVTGGYDSIFYWLYLALIIRGAVSVPRATSQILLNLTLTVYYVMAGVINISIVHTQEEETRSLNSLPPRIHSATNRVGRTGSHRQPAPLVTTTIVNVVQSSTNDWTLQTRSLQAVESEAAQETPAAFGTLDSPTQTLTVRLVLLILMTVCCYGVQVLLERQRRAVEEAREFAMREGQLRSAGRVAAEFTHQIKNPLAIINNAAFSIQRALKNGKAVAPEQVRIIQEEVEHSDRIITQIMGYAQLSESHVEKLNLVEELDLAIASVFPPAAGYPIRVHRDYGGDFPPMFMQRRHLIDTLTNLLQNAREAMEEQGGQVYVAARCQADLSVEVSIRDEGPGIAADKLGRIFEAYYTTKPKGTGLGLASVKHNVELYGGSVRVESELGKGARFVLLFPARALIKVSKTA